MGNLVQLGQVSVFEWYDLSALIIPDSNVYDSACYEELGQKAQI